MSTAEQQQEEAYATLTTILDKACADYQLLEIEYVPKQLLPPATPFLQDGPALGLSKAYVAAGFLHARRLFFSTTFQLQNAAQDVKLLLLDSNDIADTLRKVTAVLLLHDSEHLTAANARKRLLLALQRQVHSASDDTQVQSQTLENAIRIEVWLLDTLHGSPLKKHSKSPTLWAHRAWLARTVGQNVLQHALRIDSVEELLAREMRVVIKAAHHHPQNYYAWTHARLLLANHVSVGEDASISTKAVDQAVLEPVQSFCMLHVRDSSAWSFFAHAVNYWVQHAHEITIGKPDVISSLEYRIRKVLEAAVDMRYEHAPIWLFLMEVLARNIDLQAMLKAHVASDILSAIDSKRSSTIFKAHLADVLRQLADGSPATMSSEDG